MSISSEVFLSIPVVDLPPDFQLRALRWGAGFAHCTYFEPNDLSYPQGPFERLLAVAPTGAEAAYSLAELGRAPTAQVEANLRCGFITYDAKNDIEALTSQNFDGFTWPTLHFFRPQTWLRWRGETLEIHGRTARRFAADSGAAVGSLLLRLVYPRCARAYPSPTTSAP